MNKLPLFTAYCLLAGARDEKQTKLNKLRKEWGENLTHRQKKAIAKLEAKIAEYNEIIPQLETFMANKKETTLWTDNLVTNKWLTNLKSPLKKPKDGLTLLNSTTIQHSAVWKTALKKKNVTSLCSSTRLTTAKAMGLCAHTLAVGNGFPLNLTN